LQLFELPEPSAGSTPPQQRLTAERGGDRARPARGSEVERRPLPDLPARAERGGRGQRERAERERGAPPGRAIARERSGRENAERGLERAREARERNKEKK
jgi:hypothetical protein